MFKTLHISRERILEMMTAFLHVLKSLPLCVPSLPLPHTLEPCAGDVSRAAAESNERERDRGERKDERRRRGESGIEREKATSFRGYVSFL